MNFTLIITKTKIIYNSYVTKVNEHFEKRLQ